MPLKLSKEHIQVLLAAKPEDVTIEDWLPDVISDIQTIVAHREKVLTTIEELYQKYRTEVDTLEEDLEKLAAECPHWLTVYQGDPAGGSDSYSYCEICGADL